ncbi:Ribonuclease J [subsurface metagenome]
MTKRRLKIIPLGGLSEIGKNMMMMEYENDIIVIDAGLMFPEEEMPGLCFPRKKC